MNFHRYVLNISFLAALLLLTGSCSKEEHDDDVNSNNGGSKMAYTVTKVQERPSWAIDYSYNDEKPDWSEPNIQFYENWCIIMVRLQDVLAVHASDEDMLAVFINNELRGFARPAIDLGENVGQDGVYFIVNVFGNEISSDSVSLTIKYYSANLHNIFSLAGEDVFEPEKVYGIKGDFIPEFTRGSQKFPISHPIALSYTENPDKGFDIAEGDMLGAFVGDECRMVYHIDKNLLNGILYTTILGRESNEQAEIRYYSSQKNEVYIFKDKVTLQSTIELYPFQF